MPSLAPLVRFAAVSVALAACHREADDPQRAARREARDLARQAAALAAGDSSARPGRTRRADSGSHFSMTTDDGTHLARNDDPPLGPGDVRVVSTDGVVVLAVIGDTVRTSLGDSAVARMKHEMAADADTAADGIGGFVARTVQSAVAGGMSAASRFALRVPVRDVRDLRYESGELRFRTGKNGRTNARVAPGDAERFVAAVRARQQRPAGR